MAPVDVESVGRMKPSLAARSRRRSARRAEALIELQMVVERVIREDLARDKSLSAEDRERIFNRIMTRIDRFGTGEGDSDDQDDAGECGVRVPRNGPKPSGQASAKSPLGGE